MFKVKYIVWDNKGSVIHHSIYFTFSKEDAIENARQVYQNEFIRHKKQVTVYNDDGVIKHKISWDAEPVLIYSHGQKNIKHGNIKRD